MPCSLTNNQQPATNNRLPWEQLRAVIAAQPEEHLFVVVSGSHLYGYPSVDSDIDLRGCYRVPTDHLFALERPPESVERLAPVDGREVETVSHEVEKLLRLFLKRNGTLLEQIYAPLVVVETPALAELRELARGCITRGLYQHYRALMHTVGQQYRRAEPRRAKPLLALYRMAMTAIHLLRHGEIETNLPRLNESFGFSVIEELVAIKATAEAATIDEEEPYLADLAVLDRMLDEAYAASRLPDRPADREGLDAFLYRQRWEGLRL